MVVVDLNEWKHTRCCRCQTAVLRAFDELVKRNESLKVAEEAAVIVYRYHHPEIPFEGAVDTVSSWIRNRVAERTV